MVEFLFCFSHFGFYDDKLYIVELKQQQVKYFSYDIRKSEQTTEI